MSQGKSIEEIARELFDRASGRLDTATSNRLHRFRREALSTPTRAASRLLPLLATASLLALALAWWLPRPVPVPAAEPVAVDPALLEADEDNEIYAWLSDAPVAPDAESGGAL